MIEAEEATANELTARGFRVERIPRQATKTADFIAHDDRHSYLVEVTHRKLDGFWDRLRTDSEKDGIAFADRRPGAAKARNQLGAKVRNKAKQLRETVSEGDFHILWIAAFHDDWKSLATILVRTLYGAVKLAGWSDKDPSYNLYECLYWNHFAFYRDRDLNAVILDNGVGGKLMINDLSPNAKAFRESKLYAQFSPTTRLDPATTQAPHALVVSPEVDRSLKGAQHQYIHQTYGIWVSEMLESEFHGRAHISTDPGQSGASHLH